MIKMMMMIGLDLLWNRRTFGMDLPRQRSTGFEGKTHNRMVTRGMISHVTINISNVTVIIMRIQNVTVFIGKRTRTLMPRRAIWRSTKCSNRRTTTHRIPIFYKIRAIGIIGNAITTAASTAKRSPIGMATMPTYHLGFPTTRHKTTTEICIPHTRQWIIIQDTLCQASPALKHARVLCGVTISSGIPREPCRRLLGQSTGSTRAETGDATHTPSPWTPHTFCTTLLNGFC
mmetsp:Transcript_7427/g.33561  ORF Transcript_7427/g.33561 Transcript_7427/m.33561 type:complete len:231 (+) Transcript_7427:192-884(+)